MCMHALMHACTHTHTHTHITHTHTHHTTPHTHTHTHHTHTHTTPHHTHTHNRHIHAYEQTNTFIHCYLRRSIHRPPLLPSPAFSPPLPRTHVILAIVEVHSSESFKEVRVPLLLLAEPTRELVQVAFASSLARIGLRWEKTGEW